MQAPSASFVQAMSAEEACPLCLDRYAAADECTCVVCDAPSCPGCAEELDADGAMRCFACRPAQLPQRRPSQAPVSLPRPIQFPLAARAMKPDLPPLTFSLTGGAHRRGALQLVDSLPAQDDDVPAQEVNEADLVVIPAWKQRPLLVLARAADRARLYEVSAAITGWAHSGGRRMALRERSAREWALIVRAHGAQLHTRSSQLSRQLLVQLRPRGAALSSAVKLRATALFAVAMALSQRVTPLARAAWSRLPDARQLQHVMKRRLHSGLSLLGPQLQRLSFANVQLSRRQVVRYGRYRRSVRSLYSSGLRSLKKPMEALSSRILARSKSATMTPSSDRPSSLSL